MNRNHNHRKGFSLIELLIVLAIIFTIAAIAVPNYMKAQSHAKEVAALGAIKAIHAAEWQYNDRYGRFATSLTELGPPASGPESPAAAGYIERDLAAGEKQGYKFTVQATPQGYSVLAQPAVYRDGIRNFYSDQSMTVRESATQEPANANSPEVGTAAGKGGGAAPATK